MTDDKRSALIPPSRRRARRLRKIGVLVLLLGGMAAGAIYWRGMRDAGLHDDISMQGFNRTQRQQMARLYGKSGLLIEEWTDDLKQPGTQSILIAGFSAAAFAVCFYVARLLDCDDNAA